MPDLRTLREVAARPQGLGPTAAAHAVVVAVYLVLAAWGDAVADEDGLTLWYPAAGWAVAAVRLGGPRYIPAVVLGELLSDVLIDRLVDDLGVAPALLNGVVVGLGFAVAGLALRRTASDAAVPGIHAVGAMVATFAVAAAPLALVDVGIQRSRDALTDPFGDALRVWYLGALVGMLTIAPAVILATQVRRTDQDVVPRPAIRSWVGAVEIAAVVVVPVGVVALLDQADVLYLCIAPVILVAMRRAHPGSAIAAAVVASIVVTALAIRGGQFEREAVSVLLALTAVTGLVLGVVVAERFASVRANERLAEAIERGGDMVAIVALDGWPRWWNAAAARFVAPPGGGPRPVWNILVGGRERADQVSTQLAGSDTWEGDLVLQTDDGEQVPVSASIVPDIDDRGVRVGYTLVARDMSARQAYEAELARRALHDDLTGIPNRALLLERLDHTISRLRRSGGHAALLLFDIDRFKVVNDSLGHAVGDRLLQAITERVATTLRTSDTLARFGGDEFIILAEDLDDPDDGRRIAQHVLRALRQPFTIESGTIVSSASIGVVRVDPDEPAEELLRHADLAMYRAKADGGGRYAVYEDQMSHTAERRLMIESTLRTVLREGRVRIHFQPVIDLRSGATVFAEALLRIDWPDLGPVPPPEVITVAHETGLLTDLGHLIAAAAAECARDWPEPVAVSINVSPAQLEDDQLAETLEVVCEAAGLPAERIIIELTEEAFLKDPDHAAKVLEHVRRIGARVALDDFGTGWSSLASLRLLPIDILKLDQSLLAGLEARDARAIVTAVVGVAAALDLTVVGEGIETDDQLDISLSLGCALGQGFGIARPMAPADLSDWFGVRDEA